MSNIGRRGALGIGIEAEAAGTTTTIKHFLPYLSCDLIERHTPIADNSAKGVRDEQGANPVEGKKWGEGSVEVVLDPTTAPYWFGLVMGGISSTLSGTLYIHTITRKADNAPLTATIYRDRVVDEVKFPYSTVENLELNFADDVAKITANIMSRYPIAEGDTPAYVDLELYTFKNAYVELTNGVTTSELKVRELTLNIGNNSEMVYAPNSNDVDRVVNKNFNVNGSIVIDFENETQKSAFTNLTKQAVSIVFVGNAGGETGKITIDIPQFRVDNYTPDTPNDDIQKETIDFVGEYDGTKSIEIEVKNETASY